MESIIFCLLLLIALALTQSGSAAEIAAARRIEGSSDLNGVKHGCR